MPLKDVKILLVDDEAQFVDTLAERLTMRGIATQVAYDGASALQKVQAGPVPDVIVLDLRMPEMDGFAVLQSVKKINPQIQVIILTGHGDSDEESAAFRMGAYSFLKKPMDIEELLNSIGMAFKDKMQNAMVAATLAQGGDFASAQEIISEVDVTKK